jgi:hypothetical protein
MVYFSAHSTMGLISILISAASAGFTSASITYDFDSDVEKRRVEPDFYGFIPDEPLKRTLNFCSMTAMSSLLLLLRSISSSLLILTSPWYFALYVFIDMGTYVLQKAMRGDLLHWTPDIGMFLSFVNRLIFKTIVDFTGNIQFRGAGELGGIYWTFSMVTSIAIAPASVLIYFAKTDPEQVVRKKDLLLPTVCLLAGGWLLAFGVFLWTMNPEYRSTFFSRQTGYQWAQSHFLDGDTDEKKARIVYRDRHLWSSIRPQVRELFHVNWAKWEAEKPGWFTDGFKSQVDDDLIPEAAVARLVAEGGGRRWRSSAFGNMVGNGEVGGGVVVGGNQVVPEMV